MLKNTKFKTKALYKPQLALKPEIWAGFEPATFQLPVQIFQLKNFVFCKRVHMVQESPVCVSIEMFNSVKTRHIFHIWWVCLQCLCLRGSGVSYVSVRCQNHCLACDMSNETDTIGQ